MRRCCGPSGQVCPLAAQGLDALGGGQGKKIWRRHGLLSVVWLRLCALLWAKLFGRRLWGVPAGEEALPAIGLAAELHVVFGLGGDAGAVADHDDEMEPIAAQLDHRSAVVVADDADPGEFAVGAMAALARLVEEAVRFEGRGKQVIGAALAQDQRGFAPQVEGRVLAAELGEDELAVGGGAEPAIETVPCSQVSRDGAARRAWPPMRCW